MTLRNARRNDEDIYVADFIQICASNLTKIAQK